MPTPTATVMLAKVMSSSASGIFPPSALLLPTTLPMKTHLVLALTASLAAAAVEH
ncbi:hypothetical protein H6H01_06375 [Nostoc calcicola FACHB-3891]|nr:hypothetical protein [Nostoc calcicola FACHB-3891]